MDAKVKCFRRKFPSMDPCLCGYCFYSNEEENERLAAKAWLVNRTDIDKDSLAGSRVSPLQFTSSLTHLFFGH